MDDARRAGNRQATAAAHARTKITPAMILGSRDVCCVHFDITRDRTKLKRDADSQPAADR